MLRTLRDRNVVALDAITRTDWDNLFDLQQNLWPQVSEVGEWLRPLTEDEISARAWEARWLELRDELTNEQRDILGLVEGVHAAVEKTRREETEETPDA